MKPLIPYRIGFKKQCAFCGDATMTQRVPRARWMLLFPGSRLLRCDRCRRRTLVLWPW